MSDKPKRPDADAIIAAHRQAIAEYGALLVQRESLAEQIATARRRVDALVAAGAILPAEIPESKKPSE